MAKIKYLGKKKNFNIPLPSGAVSVSPGDIFDAKGADLVHVKRLMQIEREHCDAVAGWSLITADEHEMLEIEGLTRGGAESVEENVPNVDESDNTNIDSTDSDEASTLSYSELKKLAEEKGIKTGRIKKEELLKILQENGEQDEADQG